VTVVSTCLSCLIINTYFNTQYVNLSEKLFKSKFLPTQSSFRPLANPLSQTHLSVPFIATQRPFLQDLVQPIIAGKFAIYLYYDQAFLIKKQTKRSHNTTYINVVIRLTLWYALAYLTELYNYTNLYYLLFLTVSTNSLYYTTQISSTCTVSAICPIQSKPFQAGTSVAANGVLTGLVTFCHLYTLVYIYRNIFYLDLT